MDNTTPSSFAADAELSLPARRPFNWKLFLILWVATLVAVAAVLPYTFTSQSGTLAASLAQLTIPLWVVIVVQIGQNMVLFALASGVGLLLACRIGLGLPFLEGWLNGRPIWQRLPRVAALAVPVGAIGGALIIAIDKWVFSPRLKVLLAASGAPASATAAPPAWQGLLASFYGGIAEEVLLRLLVLTLLAWLGSLISHDAHDRPTLAVLWIANVLAAVLFGLGHLPGTAAAGIPLTALVVVRAVVLNGLLGIAFGWLYWTRGLESAIIGHFSADLILHVLLALV
jgi:membrane protease YdiL (CAAX protease family)